MAQQLWLPWMVKEPFFNMGKTFLNWLVILLHAHGLWWNKLWMLVVKVWWWCIYHQILSAIKVIDRTDTRMDGLIFHALIKHFRFVKECKFQSLFSSWFLNKYLHAWLHILCSFISWFWLFRILFSIIQGANCSKEIAVVDALFLAEKRCHLE